VQSQRAIRSFTNAVHRHIHPTTTYLRGHRQEKLPSARLARSIGFVLHNPWCFRGVRDADRHVDLTVIWSSFNSSSVGGAINPARDLGPRVMTAMVGYGRQGTANLNQAVQSKSLILDLFLMQSSIIVVSTGSGPLFWALFVADFLPPSSMMS
jgi:hypothetical protein